MKSLKTDQGGFTLIEAIVAMCICTVGLVAMAELMAVTLRLQQLGRNSTSAVRLAQDKVDELTTMNFATNPSVFCGGSLTTDAGNYSDIAMDDMIERCRALKLRATVSEVRTRLALTALLSTKAVSSLYSASRRQSFAI